MREKNQSKQKIALKNSANKKKNNPKRSTRVAFKKKIMRKKEWRNNKYRQHETTRKKNHGKQKRKRLRRSNLYKKLLLEIGSTLLISISIIWLFSLFTFTFAKVEGYGMIPTLADKEMVFINRNSVKRRFKLAYIRKPDGRGNDIRRIIGLPGESVNYKGDQLYINGNIVVEKFIYEEIGQAKNTDNSYTEDFNLEEDFGLTRIPEKNYLVLGDNRPYSTDSRYYGLVEEKDIIGIVEMRILPINLLEQL
ncbi:signal peptidase I [Candidatus Enterococcus mansonii]|uniref:Signal peptidase I n=1 Tax=Candidatus Enterococcus mansonii TaxID=1834181 RepID=A0A242CHZ0_9ENTE|nr:signal peptidase I [Enterococcus sp. 4G2_DIV0659]OTO09831.1 hypothetical protein A5880_000514 [Enterococcus sp. 4G2_DIV0659]